LWRVPILKVLDIAPVASLGLACGRTGCFLAGDGDYGVPTSMPWGMSFPHGIVPTTVRVHPTPLYEVACSLILFAVLWHMGRAENYKKLAPGTLLVGYLFGTGFFRFFIEFLSRNARVFAGLTEAQWVGICFMVCAGSIRLVQMQSGGVHAAGGDSALSPGSAT
jgi:phosphatidylglycerol:prolipoprotein diacylglycerol transferase